MNMNSAVRRLVVGLGNPGDRFALTRHNVGALALDHIVEKFLPSFSSDPEGKDYKLQKSDEMNAFLCETNIGFFQGGEPGRDGRVVDYDFVDAVSSRRRARTRNEGVPFTNVDLVLMRPGTYMNQSGSKTQSLIEDPPALPKLAEKNLTKAIKVEKNATKAISSKMVSPKKPSSKTNVDLKSVKIQSVALKKISPKPLNAINPEPKSAVK